jgi:hypothetical protein
VTQADSVSVSRDSRTGSAKHHVLREKTKGIGQTGEP